LKILNIYRVIGRVSAAITVICSAFGSFNERTLIWKAATYVGISIGWQLTQFGITNDIAEMLSGKLKRNI
jgi:hypothetical protein